MSDRDPRGPALIALLGLLTAFGPMAIDMYLPALPTMRAELGASTASVQLTLSAFTVGIAVGTPPIAWVMARSGRRIGLAAGMGISAAGAGTAASATDPEA